MATTRGAVAEPLPTIWRVSDELWAILEPILADLDPPARTGRPRVDQRKALDGLIYHLRTGCQWNALPREFGDDSSVHRTFQRWLELDVLDGIWGHLLEACEDLGGVDWEWQAADGALGKARKKGTASDRIRPIGANRA
jgi:putative transposase